MLCESMCVDTCIRTLKPQTTGPGYSLGDIFEMPRFTAVEFILAPGHHAQNDSARCTKCTKCGDLEPCRLSRYMAVTAGSRCRSTSRCRPRRRPQTYRPYRPCQSPCSRSTHGVGLRRRRDIFMFTSNRDAQGRIGRMVCFDI